MLDRTRRWYRESHLGMKVLGLTVLVSFAIIVLLGIVSWLAIGWINPANASDRINLLTGAAQALVGFTLLIGVVFTWLGLQNSRETLEHSIETTYSNRYFTAVEKLAHENEEVRVGAILSLSQLVEVSRSHYQHSIEVLLYFVRRNTELKAVDSETWIDTPDVQAAITAVCRKRDLGPNQVRRPLDFRSLNLRGRDFELGWLEGCDFRGSLLVGAGFQGALLCDAQFQAADCGGCAFQNAELQGAKFNSVSLLRAQFSTKDDPTTRQGGAWVDLAPRMRFDEPPEWIESDKVRQTRGIRLKDTDFTLAELDFTNFQDVDLSKSFGLFREQLDAARTEGAVLPTDLPTREEWQTKNLGIEPTEDEQEEPSNAV